MTAPTRIIKIAQTVSRVLEDASFFEDEVAITEVGAELLTANESGRLASTFMVFTADGRKFRVQISED